MYVVKTQYTPRGRWEYEKGSKFENKADAEKLAQGLRDHISQFHQQQKANGQPINYPNVRVKVEKLK